MACGIKTQKYPVKEGLSEWLDFNTSSHSVLHRQLFNQSDLPIYLDDIYTATTAPRTHKRFICLLIIQNTEQVSPLSLPSHGITKTQFNNQGNSLIEQKYIVEMHHHLTLLMLLMILLNRILLVTPTLLTQRSLADSKTLPSAATLSHCPSKCGYFDLTDVYPFGIGEGCFRPGFELICDNKTEPPCSS